MLRKAQADYYIGLEEYIGVCNSLILYFKSFVSKN